MNAVATFGMMIALVLGPGAAFGQRPALVLIDMQPYFAERRGNHEIPANQIKLLKVLRRQRDLIQLAKRMEMPIVVVEYDLTERFQRGVEVFGDRTHADLRAEIGLYPTTILVRKTSDGVFSRGSGVAAEVGDFLDAHAVDEVILVGANGGSCVQCSIGEALGEGYRVAVDARAVIDFNRLDFVHPYRYADSVLHEDPNVVTRMFTQGDVTARFVRAATDRGAAAGHCEFRLKSVAPAPSRFDGLWRGLRTFLTAPFGPSRTGEVP